MKSAYSLDLHKQLVSTFAIYTFFKF